jgi:hypothetical protein
MKKHVQDQNLNPNNNLILSNITIENQSIVQSDDISLVNHSISNVSSEYESSESELIDQDVANHNLMFNKFMNTQFDDIEKENEEYKKIYGCDLYSRVNGKLVNPYPTVNKNQVNGNQVLETNQGNQAIESNQDNQVLKSNQISAVFVGVGHEINNNLILSNVTTSNENNTANECNTDQDQLQEEFGYDYAEFKRRKQEEIEKQEIEKAIDDADQALTEQAKQQSRPRGRPSNKKQDKEIGKAIDDDGDDELFNAQTKQGRSSKKQGRCRK